MDEMMGISVITGASSGIGAAAAIELTRRGKQVLITGRSSQKLHAVYEKMLFVAPRGSKVPTPVAADLASLSGVRELADRILETCPQLDLLVNNAAVQPSKRQESADGFELGLAVNHLAVFLLTNLLARRLLESSGQVITTASSSHTKGAFDFEDLQLRHGWTGSLSYGRSKLANILFTRVLRERTSLAASCFHPGAIRTDINRDSPFVRVVKPFERFVLSSPEKGADTLVWLAEQPRVEAPTAVYYADRKPAEISTLGRDLDLANRLWEASMELTRAEEWPAG
ncbi:SDR family NAD(P)-dependent oxidoreductase [Streptomyces sp. NPDC058525]|uniref:SDR family NAD(P)-dependent oxidoreductase n=1 Tax=Streptomyces sp. NPDC058525 TaxID=3346538 RepID=UPI003669F937